MRSTAAGCLALLALSCVAPAQALKQSQATSPRRETFPGLHHPIEAKNPEAQRQFDLGLGLIYSLDFSGAAKAFEHAATLDPKAAMAYWGISYALGSDYYYHSAGSPQREAMAHEALRRAMALAPLAPAQEQAYIAALSKRYCDCPNPDRRQEAADFRDAMRELTRRYPNDLDAAVLYSQSITNLSPGWLWNTDGTPWEGTPEAVAVLEAVLKRNPHHIGAAHYYMHAVEGSPHPERALPYTSLLPSLAPSIGHIVHMPAHIYIRTGDYELAEQACQKASLIDHREIERSSRVDMFIVLSYLHDLYFLAAAASMDGHFQTAKAAADQLNAQVEPHLEDMPQLQAFLPVLPAVLVRFGRRDEILRLPAPASNFRTAAALWHFARGMAFATSGRDVDAKMEHQALTSAVNETAASEVFAMSPNRTRDVLTIAADILSAKIATAEKDRKQAIEQLREAVALQDGLNYSEPPSWFYPVRESLGAALLLDGQPSEAEATFREDLQRNPRNPRSLFGLSQVLRANGKRDEAADVERKFEQAWKGDRTELDLKSF